MSTSFDLPEPDLFTAGTVGPPGQRVFYIQARGEGVIVSLRCEKQQVAALAEYLAGILEDLPPVEADALPDAVDLVEPVVAEWVIGALAVAWDEEADRVLLVAEEFVPGQGDDPDDTDDPDGPDAPDVELGDPGAVDERAGDPPANARFRITRAQASAFVERTRDLVSAGRPPCPICGRPVDPDGHICPRTNGHRARSRP